MTLNDEDFDFDPKQRVVMAVGPNGVGKSTLLNILATGGVTDPDHGFQPGGGIDSVTLDIVVKRFGNTLFVDTPGLGDRNGKDTQNIAMMAKELRDLKRMHLFLLVLKGQDQRINTHTRDVIDVLAACFGIGFLSNAALVFTHWPRDERSLTRLANQGRSEEGHAAAFNKYFQEAFDIESLELPCFFLDSVDFQEDPGLYTSQIDSIMDLARRLDPYDCRDARDVMMERDQALAALEEAQKQRDEEAEAARLAQQQREEADRRAQQAEARAQQEAAAAHLAQQQREEAERRADQEAAAARLAQQQKEEANTRARQEAEAARIAKQKMEEAVHRAQQEAEAARLAKQEKEKAEQRAAEQAEIARLEADRSARLAQRQKEEADRRAARLAQQQKEEAEQRAAEQAEIARLASRPWKRHVVDVPGQVLSSKARHLCKMSFIFLVRDCNRVMEWKQFLASYVGIPVEEMGKIDFPFGEGGVERTKSCEDWCTTGPGGSGDLVYKQYRFGYLKQEG